MDPEKIDQAEAGTYKGQIKYTVEGVSNHQEFIIDMECVIQPLFTIDVTHALFA